MDMEDLSTMPREMMLPQAIRHLEAKCERLKHLIGAERGPGAQMAKRRMEAEVWAIELVIAKAKGEF